MSHGSRARSMSLDGIEILRLSDLGLTLGQRFKEEPNRCFSVGPASVLVVYGLDDDLKVEIKQTEESLESGFNNGAFRSVDFSNCEPHERSLRLDFCHKFAAMTFMNRYLGGVQNGKG